MRGVGAELQGGLVGGLAEVGEEVADLLLAGVDDLTGGGAVDGGGHVLTEALEAAPQLVEQVVRREGGFGRHGLLQGGKASQGQARPAQLRSLLNVGAPERFATPAADLVSATSAK